MKLTDTVLKNAVVEIERGLVGVYLGAEIIKKRIALSGQGKRGSVRTIIAFRHEHRTIYMYGFPKNKRSNISRNEAL